MAGRPKKARKDHAYGRLQPTAGGQQGQEDNTEGDKESAPAGNEIGTEDAKNRATGKSQLLKIIS